MTVTTFLFFLFAALAAVIFHFLPQRFKLPGLLVVSLAFLFTWSWQFVISLAVLTLINYWIGLHLNPENKKNGLWLYSGIAINILAILIFKYSDFYLPKLAALFGESSDGLKLLVPIGLSFMVVQWIGYLMDISNGRLQAQKDLVQFSLYGFYFPRVVSGPVEKAKQFFARLEKPLTVDRPLLERSAVLIITGLTRKLVFADPLFNLIPAAAFTAPAQYDGQQLLFWLVGYAFALYNDFAGYTLIIRGVSLWFGIELTNNFNLPYLSRSFSEFWSRWHISLSNWLRDYIYLPLSWKIMHSKWKIKVWVNMILPPLITMGVSALWHGISWNMLVWGGLHAVYQIMEYMSQKFRPQPPLNERPRWQQVLNTGVTFLFAILAWVPFKMPIATAVAYWQSLLHWTLPDLHLYVQALKNEIPFPALTGTQYINLTMLALLVLAIFFDLSQNRHKSETFLQSWPRWAQVTLIVVLLFVILLATYANNVAPFVYQSF
ncbi:MAG: MBOAT family O-acyltransferase [Anaerolineaceae bacterium]|nr:MBOAT family O-acyltransferase [Anaerolineaceae bacterium]